MKLHLTYASRLFFKDELDVSLDGVKRSQMIQAVRSTVEHGKAKGEVGSQIFQTWAWMT